MNTLSVNHNMEVAHRLSQLPGKCQQIHGHSMQVHLQIVGLPLDENGIAGGIDFGNLKKVFRNYIDETFDHHLLLNIEDPWAGVLHNTDSFGKLPGLVNTPGDPTVENLAMWICRFMAEQVYEMCKKAFTMSITIEETKTNGASWAMPVGSNGEGL